MKRKPSRNAMETLRGVLSIIFLGDGWGGGGFALNTH